MYDRHDVIIDAGDFVKNNVNEHGLSQMEKYEIFLPRLIFLRFAETFFFMFLTKTNIGETFFFGKTCLYFAKLHLANFIGKLHLANFIWRNFIWRRLATQIYSLALPVLHWLCQWHWFFQKAGHTNRHTNAQLYYRLSLFIRCLI